MRRLPLFLIAALAQPAAAQIRGHDADAPVEVDADRVEVQSRADRSVLSGNVRVRQGALTLNAARVTVAYTTQGSGDPQLQRVDASGGVTLTSPNETARSSYAIYDLNRRIITMIGGVTLTRGGNTLRGGRLVYDLNSGRASVDGRAAAGGTTGTTGSSGGRVTGRFTVPRRTQ